MDLNELREAMASDATKENEELKREIESLMKTQCIFVTATLLSLKS